MAVEFSVVPDSAFGFPPLTHCCGSPIRPTVFKPTLPVLLVGISTRHLLKRGHGVGAILQSVRE
ncbi:MAG: hypothetical protein HYS57_01555 [Parcubacteria group bacterium]|nr:hypothetical protein [Parcubacteria group bacterium]